MQISSNELGYNWISNMRQLMPVQPFRITSRIGSSMSTSQQGRVTHKTYPAGF